MRVGPQMMGFFIFFFGISVMVNTYTFAHLVFMFGIPWSWRVWTVLFMMSWLYLLGMFVAAVSAGPAARVIAFLAGLWLGYMFLQPFLLLAWDAIRAVHTPDIPKEVIGTFMVALASSLVIGGAINAMVIRVHRLWIPARGLKRSVRVVQLSDLHIGPIHGPGELRRIVAKVNALGPDLVVITGDLADGPYKYEKHIFTPLKDIRAPVYLALGNHDVYTGLDRLMDMLRGTGVKVLRNRAVNVLGLRLIGLDYTLSRTQMASALKKAGVDRKRFNLLITHQPRGFQEAREAGVDLHLAGHTHGGQIWPFTFVNRIIWRRAKGIHRTGDYRIFVTTGAGTWGPPVRIRTNSEMALIMLVKKKG